MAASCTDFEVPTAGLADTAGLAGAFPHPRATPIANPIISSARSVPADPRRGEEGHLGRQRISPPPAAALTAGRRGAAGPGGSLRRSRAGPGGTGGSVPPPAPLPAHPQPGETPGGCASPSLPHTPPPPPAPPPGALRRPRRGGGLPLPRHHPSRQRLGRGAAPGRPGLDGKPAMSPTPRRSRRTPVPANPRRDRAPHPPVASGRRPSRPPPSARGRSRRPGGGALPAGGIAAALPAGLGPLLAATPAAASALSTPLRLGSPRRAPPPPPRRCGAVVPPMLPPPPPPAGWGRPRGAGRGPAGAGRARRSQAAPPGSAGARRRAQEEGDAGELRARPALRGGGAEPAFKLQRFGREARWNLPSGRRPQPL